MNRSSIDFVIRWLTFLVCLVIAVEVIGTVAIILFRPDADASPIFDALTETVTVIVGALIGFIGGRYAGRNEVPIDHLGTGALQHSQEAPHPDNQHPSSEP